MCYVHGSIDQVTSVCPMCKVFKPSGARCPHVKDVCRNRSVHPRIDIAYLKNAEVQTFNGCGHCKAAKHSIPQRYPGQQNGQQGWPGCCRPPNPAEVKFIPAADWPAVCIVHHVSMPPEIKAILDSIVGPAPLRGSGQSSPQSPPLLSATLGRSAGLQASGSPTVARRAGASASTFVKPDGKSGRSGYSPPHTASSLSRATGRTSLDAERHRDASPGKKQLETESSHRNSGRRHSVSPLLPPKPSKEEYIPEKEKRRTLNAINTNSSSPTQRSSPPSSTRSKTLETGLAELSIASPSSAGSSSGSSASSDITVDGGFTDYLSDESEAELQRQAEIRAALIAQSKMEEQEFRAARQQLATVDLRPPKSWNPNMARSQSASRPAPSYVSAGAGY